MNDQPGQEWWQTQFGEQYLTVTADVITPERTAKEVEFIVEKLDLERDAKILDLACGYGRHALEIAKIGYQVIGLDYSKHFLDIAKGNAKKEGVRITYIQGDMREITYKNEFDAVLNIFTSFGYFKEESDQALVLQKIRDALKVVGKLLVQVNNGTRTSKRIAEAGKWNEETKTFRAEGIEYLSNGLTLNKIEFWNPETKRAQTEVTWKENGETKTYRTDARLFNLQELASLVEENGLHVTEQWGDFDGGKHDPLNSKAIILLAQKQNK